MKCTYRIKVDGGKDNQGKKLFWHERCNQPAAERTVSGMLTTAKAILCPHHYRKALNESFVSDRGFRRGKVEEVEKETGYRQTLIEPVVKV